jgi:hypothetical protein
MNTINDMTISRMTLCHARVRRNAATVSPLCERWGGPDDPGRQWYVWIAATRR